MSQLWNRCFLGGTLALAVNLGAVSGYGQQPSAAAGEIIKLSLRQAIRVAQAPEGNTRVRLAGQAVEAAQAKAVEARAALLPNLDAGVVQQNQTRNLAALGIRLNVPIPGFVFPETVGPFSTFDARAGASQTILDLAAIRRLQAARSSVDAARGEKENSLELVAGQVARDYLTAWQARSRVATVQTSVSLAEELLELAESQKQVGTGTGIEVARARVQLANERQRLLVAQNQYRAAEIHLLRTIGLRLDSRVELEERFAYEPLKMTVSDALAVALKSRADLEAQRRRRETARLGYAAAKWERLPSIVGFADYGTIGSTPGSAVPTRTFGVNLRLPIFDGGRRDAHRAEKRVQLEQEITKTVDLEAQVEMEVRLALDDLQSAEALIRAADEGLKLAEEELAHATRRYKAGVTTSLEVTDAQTRLERARDNNVSAVFSFQLAKVQLALATGTVEKLIE